MVKQHLKDLKELFEEFRGFLAEQEFMDGKLKLALQSISSREDFPP